MSEVWSDRLTIYEWFNDSDVARIVVHTCWQDNYIDPRNYPQHLAPTAAVLDSRVTTRQPKRLKSIIVGLQTMKDIIEFDAGFNIAMTGVENIADDTLANTQRDGYRFTIDGTLGGGRGKFPGCDTLDIAARRINGVVPNEYGDFLVSPEECYWYERPSTVINDVKLVPDVARKNDGLTGRMRPYTMGGAWPTYTAEWETLNAFHSGRLSFLLKGCDTIDGNSLRVTVTAVFADEAYPAITEVTSFEGDCEPADPCPASA